VFSNAGVTKLIACVTFLKKKELRKKKKDNI